MTAAVSDTGWPWLALLAAAAVTYLWRGLGVALSGRLRTDGAVFEWVSAVAYALLAGLIARMVAQPLGPLQATPLTDRLVALGAGLAAFALTGRRGILWGTVAGVVTLSLLAAVRWGGG
ncbi:MAG: AzlD domain-containing protein [Rhodospirillaceae bacterium]|nr:AzlD domain-containing protein [Rhodospirillaceae bacterium]